MQQQQQQTQYSHNQPQQQPARPRWGRYYIQRVNTNVNHVLFYVIDEAGTGKLAAVGTDVKLSGHFVYASVGDMTAAPPLRCTNRQKVLEWLAELGAVELAEDHEVTLPQLAPSHWQQLHSTNPMLCKPKLDRNYRTWRQDTGVLADGRHYKHYLLVDASTGAERLAVVGEDTARLDRRYTYKALDDMGGFCFENGKAVNDWLDFVVGKTNELPANFIKRERPPDRRSRSNKGSKGRTAAGGTATEDDLESMAVGVAYGIPSGRNPVPLSAAEAPGRLQPPTRYGSGIMLPPATGGAARGSMYALSASPQQYEHQQQQQHYHGGPAAAAQYQTPAAARYGPGALQPMGPGGGEFSMPAGGAGARAPGLAGNSDLTAAVRVAGEEVRQLFAVGGHTLLEFVTHVPDQDSVELVSEMSRRLSLFVDALGLRGQPVSCDVVTGEVMGYLQLLADRPASLKLLETTGIGRPVALLGCMHDVLAAQGQQLTLEAGRELQPVYELARHLASVWQDLAASAHKLANEALESSPTPL